MKIKKGSVRDERFLVPYRVYGEADKTLVCVSGAQQTMAVWRSFTSYFLKEYSIVVFDSPGQGRSRVLSGPPAVSMDEQVEVLHSIVRETHNYEPVHLAAASWGTIVAAAFAARHPAAVDKMVLGSFGVKPSKTMLDVIKEGQQLYDENNGPAIAHLMIERFGQYIPDSYKTRIIEQFRQMTREQFLSFYAHCEFVENARHINNFVDLRNIKAPTLIVNGEHDTILDLEDGVVASAQIPNCEVKIVPGAGHFLHFEHEEILEIYKEFLSRNGSALNCSPVAATA